MPSLESRIAMSWDMFELWWNQCFGSISVIHKNRFRIRPFNVNFNKILKFKTLKYLNFFPLNLTLFPENLKFSFIFLRKIKIKKDNFMTTEHSHAFFGLDFTSWIRIRQNYMVRADPDSKHWMESLEQRIK